MPASTARYVHRFFLSECGKTAFDKDEVADLFRPLGGVRIRDVTAQIVTDDCHPFYTQRFDQLMKPARDGLLVETGLGFRGIAEAREIGRDYIELLTQQRHDTPPRPGRLRPTMQKQHGLFRAGRCAATIG
ncbi:hypothetical protein D3C72_1261090 [compost metagenome]